MKKRILLNIGEKESRVAFLEDDTLVELFVEQTDDKNKVGNVYKGVIEGVVPGIQAAFVNIGLAKNAFLHFNDVNMEPFIAEALQEKQIIRRRGRRRVTSGPAPDQGFYIRVEDCLKPGREILVQMTKEAIGTKGARVSANFTLPGKYLVLLPNIEGQGGVSKKVEDLKERRRLKKILSKIEVDNASFIVRTAGIGKTPQQIYSDVDNLLDTWDEIQEKFKKMQKPGVLHQEHDLIHRLVRDHFPDDVHEILIDDETATKEVSDALREFNMPEAAKRAKYWGKTGNLFEKFNVEQQINAALKRSVALKCGGTLVFDETEALTAIDVNTGSFTGSKDQEKTILKANLEAAEAVARQLRLRDIGGLIVVDFIDMATRDAQRKVLNAFRDALMQGGDKFSLGRFSEFGCVELTRKRVRHSLRKSLTKECPYCGGMGRLRVESQIWRDVKYTLLSLFNKHKAGNYEIIVHPHIADYLNEELSDLLWRWEKEFGVRLDVRVQKTYHFETYSIVHNGKVVAESGKDKIADYHDVDYLEPSVSVEVEEEAKEITDGFLVKEGGEVIAKVTEVAEIPEEVELADEYEEAEQEEPEEDRASTEPLTSRRRPRRRRSRGRDRDRTETTSDDGHSDRREVPEEVMEDEPVAADAEEFEKVEIGEEPAEAKEETATAMGPGLYGRLGEPVKTAKRFKRARFDENQDRGSHYGWTYMGPAVGRTGPAKQPRVASDIMNADAVKGVEPSLFARTLVKPEETSKSEEPEKTEKTKRSRARGKAKAEDDKPKKETAKTKKSAKTTKKSSPSKTADGKKAEKPKRSPRKSSSKKSDSSAKGGKKSPSKAKTKTSKAGSKSTARKGGTRKGSKSKTAASADA